jgi:hypothetical protein
MRLFKRCLIIIVLFLISIFLIAPSADAATAPADTQAG